MTCHLRIKLSSSSTAFQDCPQVSLMALMTLLLLSSLLLLLSSSLLVVVVVVVVFVVVVVVSFVFSVAKLISVGRLFRSIHPALQLMYSKFNGTPAPLLKCLRTNLSVARDWAASRVTGQPRAVNVIKLSAPRTTY